MRVCFLRHDTMRGGGNLSNQVLVNKEILSIVCYTTRKSSWVVRHPLDVHRHMHEHRKSHQQ